MGHLPFFRDAESCHHACFNAGSISEDSGTGGRVLAVKLCVYLKVRCHFRRGDLPAVGFLFNEGIGNMFLGELEDR